MRWLFVGLVLASAVIGLANPSETEAQTVTCSTWSSAATCFGSDGSVYHCSVYPGSTTCTKISDGSPAAAAMMFTVPCWQVEQMYGSGSVGARLGLSYPTSSTCARSAPTPTAGPVPESPSQATVERNFCFPC